MPPALRQTCVLFGFLLRVVHFQIAACVAACAVIGLPTVAMIYGQHTAAIERHRVSLRNMSMALADETDRIVGSLELVERQLESRLNEDDQPSAAGSGRASSQAMHMLIADMVSGVPAASALAIIDRDGNLVNLVDAWPVPIRSLANREYFQFAKSHPEAKSFVSEPTVNLQTDRPCFFVVRRLVGPDGAFKGIIIGRVEIGYMEKLYSGNTIATGTSLTLFRDDGIILARYPSGPVELAKAYQAHFHALFENCENAPFLRRNVISGTQGMFACGRLSGHPLMVSVAEPYDNAMAGWRAQAIWTGALAALASTTLLLVSFLAARRFQDQRRLEAASAALSLEEQRLRAEDQHRQAEQEIARQHQFFLRALDSISQGILMFDEKDTLIAYNAATNAVFGLPEGTLWQGMSLEEIIEVVAENGSILRHDIDRTLAFYLNLRAANEPAKFIRKVADGRTLATNYTPRDDGWIITYEDVSELRKADERIAHMAHHDALTGLPNRNTLRAWIDEALSADTRLGRFAVLCLDLDHFKDVNDTLGHPAGDKMLCEVARRVRSVIRRTDVVVRLGGDEFAILAMPADDRDAVAALATRIIEEIRAPFILDGQMIFVGTSVGIAMAAEHGDNADTLMRNADLALYRAKADGRGCYVFFEAAMQQGLLERRRVESELRTALEQGQLELHYQPVVDAATLRILGFEALMRWRHPLRGLVSPCEFIPIAEDNGLITQLGEWALLEACREAAGWPGGRKVAVNLSPIQFRSAGLVSAVMKALAASGLEPHRLELEITESAMMRDPDETLAILDQLKALGTRILMDDFGTGYSSLAYLKTFPFDKVKLDQTFARDLDAPSNLAIIRAVIGIAESLSIRTIIEGVETNAQFNRVVAEGCDEVQGFLFGRPIPASEIAFLPAILTPIMDAAAA